MVTPNSECTEMLSSATDLCLIFIRPAEAEHVRGEAVVAPSLLGRSDYRSQSQNQDQHQGHSHRNHCCHLPSSHHRYHHHPWDGGHRAVHINCPSGAASLMVQTDLESIILWQWGRNTHKLLQGQKERELNRVVMVYMWGGGRE